jgi:hypothetical protein
MIEYRPCDKEPFMNERQREYFRKKLLAWKSNVLKEVKVSLAHLQKEDRIILISLTALHPRLYGQLNCTPAIDSAN